MGKRKEQRPKLLYGERALSQNPNKKKSNTSVRFSLHENETFAIPPRGANSWHSISREDLSSRSSAHNTAYARSPQARVYKRQSSSSNFAIYPRPSRSDMNTGRLNNGYLVISSGRSHDQFGLSPGRYSADMQATNHHPFAPDRYPVYGVSGRTSSSTTRPNSSRYSLISAGRPAGTWETTYQHEYNNLPHRRLYTNFDTMSPSRVGVVYQTNVTGIPVLYPDQPRNVYVPQSDLCVIRCNPERGSIK